MKKVHRIIGYISWAALAAAFIHLCFKWSSMPEITGVHFDSEGEFDVYASKKYIAYPFIVGIVFLLLLHFASNAAATIRLGVKINEKGEGIIREIIGCLLDANKLFISAFAVYWVELVIYQHPLNEKAASFSIITLFVIFLSVCLSIPVLKRLYPCKNEHEK